MKHLTFPHLQTYPDDTLEYLKTYWERRLAYYYSFSTPAIYNQFFRVVSDINWILHRRGKGWFGDFAGSL